MNREIRIYEALAGVLRVPVTAICQWNEWGRFVLDNNYTMMDGNREEGHWDVMVSGEFKTAGKMYRL